MGLHSSKSYDFSDRLLEDIECSMNTWMGTLTCIEDSHKYRATDIKRMMLQTWKLMHDNNWQKVSFKLHQ